MKFSPHDAPDIQTFLQTNKDRIDTDPDATPFDDLRHYAYEGDGNSGGSLSSLNSGTDDADLEFEFFTTLDQGSRSSPTCTAGSQIRTSLRKVQTLITLPSTQSLNSNKQRQGLLEVKAGASIGTDISENESARTARQQVF